MNHWPTQPLGELLVTLESGARPKGGVGEIVGGIPSLGGEHVNRDGGFTWVTPKHVTREFYAGMKRGRIKRGDILVVKDGATTGKTATVRENFPFSEAAVNEHVFLLRTDRAKVQSEFVGYFLFSPVGQQQILSSFHGAAIGGIAQDFVRNVYVPVPPLAEQERIVKLLDEADELRKLRTQADHRTAALISALFHEMFGDPRANTNEHQLGTLGAVCRKISDGTHKTPTYVASGVPFVTVKNMATGQLDFSATKFISEEEHLELTKRTKPERGDILVSKDGTIGVPCPIDTDRQFSIFVSVALLKLKPELIDTKFLVSQLNTDWVQSQIREGTKGIAIRHLHLRDFRTLKLILPPLALQKKFAARVPMINAMQAEQSASRHRLDDLFQSMLHRAFSGTL